MDIYKDTTFCMSVAQEHFCDNCHTLFSVLDTNEKRKGGEREEGRQRETPQMVVDVSYDWEILSPALWHSSLYVLSLGEVFLKTLSHVTFQKILKFLVYLFAFFIRF